MYEDKIFLLHLSQTLSIVICKPIDARFEYLGTRTRVALHTDLILQKKNTRRPFPRLDF